MRAVAVRRRTSNKPAAATRNTTMTLITVATARIMPTMDHLRLRVWVVPEAVIVEHRVRRLARKAAAVAVPQEAVKKHRCYGSPPPRNQRADDDDFVSWEDNHNHNRKKNSAHRSVPNVKRI